MSEIELFTNSSGISWADWWDSWSRDLQNEHFPSWGTATRNFNRLQSLRPLYPLHFICVSLKLDANPKSLNRSRTTSWCSEGDSADSQSKPQHPFISAKELFCLMSTITLSFDSAYDFLNANSEDFCLEPELAVRERLLHRRVGWNCYCIFGVANVPSHLLCLVVFPSTFPSVNWCYRKFVFAAFPILLTFLMSISLFQFESPHSVHRNRFQVVRNYISRLCSIYVDKYEALAPKLWNAIDVEILPHRCVIYRWKFWNCLRNLFV